MTDILVLICGLLIVVLPRLVSRGGRCPSAAADSHSGWLIRAP